MRARDRICIGRRDQGFTLVETVVSVTIFVLIFVAVYGVYSKLFELIARARERTIAMSLANEKVEIIRNLPFGDIGLMSGVPLGIIDATTTEMRSNLVFEVSTAIRNVDDPFDGTLGGVPSDSSPADYKMVDITIACLTCRGLEPLSIATIVAPRLFEVSTSTNGALFVRAIDASGFPIAAADVHIENPSSTPPIIIDDVTDAGGTLELIDMPLGVQAYRITVSKPGYSTEQTYPVGAAGNPNPIKPHSTVVAEQLTQLTFAIDETSSLRFRTMFDTCAPVPSVDFDIAGRKLIGSGPSVLKYPVSSRVTDGTGELIISDLEWDTYDVGITDAAYQLMGVSTLLPIALAPNEARDVDLVVAPSSPHALMVTVKDGATGLPVPGAEVRVYKNLGVDLTQFTGRGFLTQTDWSGGAGQATTTDFSRYFSSDGNIDVSSPVGEVKLRQSFGTYAPTGELVSSAFDTGSPSNFHEILWQPSVQSPDLGPDTVRMQLASSDTGASWSFVGPDGTAATYYSPGTTTISSTHDGDRYLRYKLILATASSTMTPNISDVSFTFTSDCVPPGQATFVGLPANDYDVYVSKAGYLTPASTSVSVMNDWQSHEVILTPP